MIRQGVPPVIEEGLAELLATVTGRGTFTATVDWHDGMAASDVALVCVGTPSCPNGSLSTESLQRVCEQIGEGLASKERYFLVAIRSTVLPGTVERLVIPVLEARSGKVAGRDFGVCMVPEFLREGSSLKDFFNPPVTVIGELDARSGETAAALFQGDRRSAHSYPHRRGGKRKVRMQCIPWPEGHFRERDRKHLQGRRLRQP